MIESIRDREIAYRSQLADLGLKTKERLSSGEQKKGPGRKKAVTEEEEEHECDTCRVHVPISMVSQGVECRSMDQGIKQGVDYKISY